MKSYHKKLHFETADRRAYLNITSEIAGCLAESGIKEGLLLCNAMHITASILVPGNRYFMANSMGKGRKGFW